MKKFITIFTFAAAAFLGLTLGAQKSYGVPGFAITSITAFCDGAGQVFFTGSIPQGGFTLELKDKAGDNSGPFVSTVPPTTITITSGTSPVSYSLPLTNWNPPHLRVDSNFDTKSASLNCDGEVTPTPTATPTPTVSVTPTVTPTVSVTPSVTVTPTPTDTPTVTPTNTPSNPGGPGDGLSDGRSDGRSSAPAKQGEVLGASTLAGTGTFDSVLATIEQIAGLAIATAGTIIYGKKKTQKNTLKRTK